MNKEEKQNLRKYLDLVKRIHDGLSDEEKLKLTLKLQWERESEGRNSASQNSLDQECGTKPPGQDSN